MTDGLLVLTLLSVAAVLWCFRFVGCLLDSTAYGNGETPDYGDTIKTEAIAYWRLGEPATTMPGDTAKDEKGLQDGTYQSTALMADIQSPATPDPPILNAGQQGLVPGAPAQTSVQVNGGFVRVPFNAALNPPANKQFSVEAWVIPEWDPSETDLFRCVVASRDDTGTNKFGYILYAGPVVDPVTFATIDPAMHWQAWVGDGTTWLMLAGPTVTFGQTTYLLLTYDGLNQPNTLTLDAITPDADNPRLVQAGTTYSPNTARPLFIGMGSPETPTPRYPFLGRLQEIAFYDKVLTPSDVSDHLAKARGA